MSAQSPESGNGESKKPKDTPFSQQKLPAWEPMLTAGTVLPAFFVIGIAFIAIGAGLLFFTNTIKEIELDYTDCKNTNNDLCHEIIANKTGKELRDLCKCKVEFTLEENWDKTVYLYYGLTNFYQNHRRYVKSLDVAQLQGDVDKVPSDDCSSYDYEGTNKEKKIFPCGAIANSLFNDVITLKTQDGDLVNLNRTGIAWESDIKYKFKNPPVPEGSTLTETLQNLYAEKNLAKPTDWIKDLWELDDENENNNGLVNEDLIVWMRTAAFPNFRKLYRKIETGLKAGKYYFEIEYNFRVKSFSGTKSVVLSEVSILGGKNAFLPISYIVVGGLCLIIGIVFLIIHVKFGKLLNNKAHLQMANMMNSSEE